MQLSLFAHNAEPRPSDDLLQKVSAPGTRAYFQWTYCGGAYRWALFVVCLQCERAKQTLPHEATYMLRDNIHAFAASGVDDAWLRRHYATTRRHIKRHLHWHAIVEKTELAS